MNTQLIPQLHRTCHVCTLFLPALFNGDCSALSSEEIELVDSFVSSLPRVYKLDASNDGGTYPATDKITGLLAECVELRIFTPKPQSVH